LAPLASKDVEHILSQGLESFGIEQARRYRGGLIDAFTFLAAYPRAARLRTEIAPPVRVHRFGSHLILYDVVDEDSIVILRVRHGREDWQADLRGA
jgi:toxin ParE1/3/4